MATKDTNNKKLLFVINHLDWFWSHRLPLAKGALAKGWDVDVAVTNATGDSKLKEEGFTGLELPPSDKGFMPLTVLKTIWAIHKLIKAERPDVMHAITIKYAFIAGLAARFHRCVRVVFTLAGLGYLFSGEGTKPKLLRLLVGPLLKLAFKNPRAQIIFQNPDDMNLMIKRGFVNAEQCTLIRGSGVDLTQFPFTPLPENDNPVILMPTRLVHDKGIAVFIEAAKIVHTKNPDVRFQIAGGITHNNPLAISKTEMEDMIEGSPVEWLGKVDNMPALYQSASLICYPSYYGEGIPKVLLETCATGRPIITTDHPGCREAVNENENGLLVPIKNAQATAESIIKIVGTPETLSKMGQISRKRAENEFDVKLIVEKTLNVYDKARES